MNFDFLKDLCGLNGVYKDCTNAEKLAMTMPEQSLFTARKSAEQIAKFIYLAAHKEQMESMNFAEILHDPEVRNFIDNRYVMNAFHHIRKSGNRAVHEAEAETPEEAVDVLEDLHFVAGEVACMLGLIQNYPDFNPEIEAYPDARYTESEVNQKAMEMFAEYAKEHDAQLSRKLYYKYKVDKITDEFADMLSPISLEPGNMALSEVFEFKAKPKHETTIPMIQAHYGALVLRALKKQRGELPGNIEAREVEFEAELTVYGKNGYTTNNLIGFLYGILNDIEDADGFKITSKYYGPSIEIYSPQKSEEPGYFTEIARLGQTENFIYVCHEFSYSHGEGITAKFENGKWINLKANYASDILDKDFGDRWCCWNLDLAVDFDFEQHSEIIEELHDVVRSSIPQDQLEYCEGTWEDGEPGILCSSISWCPSKLREIQDFLDKLNKILKPIMHECDNGSDGKWYTQEAPFAVAEWAWTEDGFVITGVEL